MPGINPFCEGFCERIYFVASMEVAERWSYLQRTRIEPVDGMTARAVCFRKNKPPPLAK